MNDPRNPVLNASGTGRELFPFGAEMLLMEGRSSDVAEIAGHRRRVTAIERRIREFAAEHDELLEP